MTAHSTIYVDDLIDRFVEHVNSSEREPKCLDDLPTWLRVGPPDDDSVADERAYYDWQIRRAERTEWIDALGTRLPFPFPPSFQSLVRRYAYPDFTVGPLWLLANTGQPLYHEMSEGILGDGHLSRTLMEHGYLQFARPDTGGYDPVCFDTRRKSEGGEYPIVRIDHEAILCYDHIGNVEELAPSFLAFVREVVEKAEFAARVKP